MKIVKFGLVGIWNTALSYLVFCILIYLDIFYLIASVLSFLVGTLFSYLMNSKYTFSTNVNPRSFAKFLVVLLASIAISLLLLYVFKHVFGMNVLVAQVLVVLVRFPIVYLLLKRTVFNQVQSY